MQFNAPDPLRTCQISHAAKLGDAEKVQELLKKGHRLDIKDNRGWTPLHQATVGCHIDCIKIFLKQKKCNVNCRSYEGETPFLLACRLQGNTEVVKVLIEGGVDVNIGNNEDETPLHFACRFARIDVINLLLEAGATVNCQDFNQFTPLHEAVTSYNLSAVECLVSHGAALELRENFGRTPFFVACCEANRSVIEFLLKENVDINARANDGSTPLMLVAQNASLNLVKMLLDNGADPNLRDNRHNLALHNAAHNVNLDLLKLLLDVTDREAITTDNTRSSFTSLTILVIDSYSLECLEWLLSKGLGPSVYYQSVPYVYELPDEGEKELRYSYIPPVSFLLIKDLETMDSFTIKMLKLLLSKDFPVNARCKEELPPLVVLCGKFPQSKDAISDFRDECFNMLLAHGCNIDYSSNSHNPPDAIIASCLTDNYAMLTRLLQQCVAYDCDRLLLWIGDHLDKCTPTCVLLVIKMGLASSATLRQFSVTLNKHLTNDHAVWEDVIKFLDMNPVCSLQAQSRRAVRQWLWSVTRSSAKIREVLDSLKVPHIVQHYITTPTSER